MTLTRTQDGKLLNGIPSKRLVSLKTQKAVAALHKALLDEAPNGDFAYTIAIKGTIVGRSTIEGIIVPMTTEVSND